MYHGEPPLDRRTQKTTNLLREALHSLIREKPYDEIVVKEILDRANVGRSTFYTHYRDKDDLLRASIFDMVYPARSKPVPKSGKWSERILWFGFPMFEYHHGHRAKHAAGLGKNGSAILHVHLQRVLVELITEVLTNELHVGRSASKKIPSGLIAEYVASTFILVFNWWLETRSALSPDEANAVFRQLVLPGLAAL